MLRTLGAKRKEGGYATFALWVAVLLVFCCVAPQSSILFQYSPSSRLAENQKSLATPSALIRRKTLDETEVELIGINMRIQDFYVNGAPVGEELVTMLEVAEAQREINRWSLWNRFRDFFRRNGRPRNNAGYSDISTDYGQRIVLGLIRANRAGRKQSFSFHCPSQWTKTFKPLPLREIAQIAKKRGRDKTQIDVERVYFGYQCVPPENEMTMRFAQAQAGQDLSHYFSETRHEWKEFFTGWVGLLELQRDLQSGVSKDSRRHFSFNNYWTEKQEQNFTDRLKALPSLPSEKLSKELLSLRSEVDDLLNAVAIDGLDEFRSVDHRQTKIQAGSYNAQISHLEKSLQGMEDEKKYPIGLIHGAINRLNARYLDQEKTSKVNVLDLEGRSLIAASLYERSQREPYFFKDRPPECLITLTDYAFAIGKLGINPYAPSPSLTTESDLTDKLILHVAKERELSPQYCDRLFASKQWFIELRETNPSCVNIFESPLLQKLYTQRKDTHPTTPQQTFPEFQPATESIPPSPIKKTIL